MEPDLREVRDAAHGLIDAAVNAGEIAARLKAIARTQSVKMSNIDLDAAKDFVRVTVEMVSH
ncbi:hypothetical protein [Paraburkholderia hospita]|uniref:hypothetical protein n=1 Tax=Paraburkholderia hospita TaxID=169430 RepID=UPI001319EB37|nr:hypothetical protein [Paraburkholderia hospita]